MSEHADPVESVKTDVAKETTVKPDEAVEKTDEDYASEIAEIAADVNCKWAKLVDLHEKKCANAKEKGIKKASYDFGMECDGPTLDDVHGTICDVARAAAADVEKHKKARHA